ncbi:MAG: twin-arginine translocase subunit TatC [Salinigranum sp.]
MSSALDEDTQRMLDEGRAAAGAMLRAAQKDLQKVFIVFLVGFLGTFYALRLYVWDFFKAVTMAQMQASTRQTVEIIAQTPFDVILLQAKIALVVGLIVGSPVFLYFARDALKERGAWPQSPVPIWKLALLVAASLGLFSLGVLYGYLVFFPFTFQFLANNAISAGFTPTYSIVKWAQFIFMLTVSFGLATQLPLAMSGLAYADIVRYDTFRSKWRHATVVIFLLGALFTPPDPFTQVMWAVPVLTLYGVSLYVTKVVVTAKRGSEWIDVRGTVRARWNVLAGAAVAGFLAVYGFYTRGGRAYANGLLVQAGSSVRIGPAGSWLPVAPETAIVVYGVLGALLLLVVALMYVVYADLESNVETLGPLGDPEAVDLGPLDEEGVRAAPPEVFAAMSEAQAMEYAGDAIDAGDREKAQAIIDRFNAAQDAAVDLGPLDEEGVRAAPAEVFAAMSEEEAMEYAGDAIDAGDREKAQAIIDRFDAAQETADEDGAPAAASGGGAAGTGGAANAANELSDRTSRATGTFLEELTDGDQDEDDLGGYYEDLKFVVDSLTSKTFSIAAVFGVVLAGTFGWLYVGGIGDVFHDFLRRLPAEVRPEQVHVVALHPMEALIFEVKFSTLIAVLAILPMIAYYAWPALRERGFVYGRRRIVFGWAGALVVGLLGGFAVGYAYVAPAVISYLAADAIRANMVIAYRITDFFWLIFFTTAGIGLLLDVVVLMVLLNTAGISYRTMRGRWREVTVGILTFSAVFTPATVLTMFLMTIPLMITYGIGLAVLFVVTLGGRRDLATPRTIEF